MTDTSTHQHIQERLARCINQRSADPRAYENGLDADWQAGYLIGCCVEKDPEIWEDSHPITVEWIRRGRPQRSTPEFKSWKAGYWAGKFRNLFSK